MKTLRTIAISIKFWFLQAIIEILVTIFVYFFLRIDLVFGEPVSIKYTSIAHFYTHIIEVILGTTWAVGLKSLFLFLPYVVLFVIISYLPYFYTNKSSFRYAILNAICSVIMIIFFSVLHREYKLIDYFPIIIVTLFSSFFILLMKLKLKFKH